MAVKKLKLKGVTLPKLQPDTSVSLAEAAGMLRWTYRRTWEQLIAGRLKGRQVMRSWRVDKASVIALYNEFYGNGADDAATTD